MSSPLSEKAAKGFLIGGLRVVAGLDQDDLASEMDTNKTVIRSAEAGIADRRISLEQILERLKEIINESPQTFPIDTSRKTEIQEWADAAGFSLAGVKGFEGASVPVPTNSDNAEFNGHTHEMQLSDARKIARALSNIRQDMSLTRKQRAKDLGYHQSVYGDMEQTDPPNVVLLRNNIGSLLYKLDCKTIPELLQKGEEAGKRAEEAAKRAKENDENVITALYGIRIAWDEKQYEFAARLGLNPSVYNTIEARSRPPSPESFQKIFSGFGCVNAAEFLERVPEFREKQHLPEGFWDGVAAVAAGNAEDTFHTESIQKEDRPQVR